MYTVIKYIHEHINEKLTVTDLTKQFGYSKWYFCDLFRNLQGQLWWNIFGIIECSWPCWIFWTERNVLMLQFDTDTKRKAGLTRPH